MLRRLIGAAALALAACGGIALPFASQEPAPAPLELEVPAGYRGYVVLQYAQASCGALPRRDGYAVVTFGADGRACTSELGIAPTLRDRAFLVEAGGARDEFLEWTFELVRPETSRIIGTVFATVPDPLVIRAIDQCRWDEAPCWEGLRSR